jgi:type IV pilus assembly protein PilF
MSMQLQDTSRLNVVRLAVTSTLALICVACASSGGNSLHTSHANNQKDAAAYNVQLGIDYMNQGDLARAKDKLDRAVKENPSNADVHSARAQLFGRMGEVKEADDEYRTALRLAPNDPRMENNYAVYLCQNTRTDEGVKRFMAAAHNPLYGTPEAAYTNAGVCLHAAKRDDEAQADFVRALQQKPNFAEAAFQLANLQFQRGQLPAARAGIDSFMSTYEATPDLLLLAVQVARAQGDRLAAQKYSRRLQMDYPDTNQTRALAGLDHNPG